MRWITPRIGAAVFGGLHALLVALPMIATGGNGEGQAFAAMMFDLPLFALLSLFEGGRSLLYNGPSWAYIAVFVIGGTLMYCAIGALVGLAMQRLTRAVQSRARAD